MWIDPNLGGIAMDQVGKLQSHGIGGKRKRYLLEAGLM